MKIDISCNNDESFTLFVNNTTVSEETTPEIVSTTTTVPPVVHSDPPLTGPKPVPFQTEITSGMSGWFRGTSWE